MTTPPKTDSSGQTRPVSLVTGASSGIGAAIAEGLARRGYDLVLVARREERLTELASRLADEDARSEVFVADLSDPLDIDKVATRLGCGDIELLVSDAGASGYVALADTDAGTLQRNWTLNTTATLLLTRAIVPSLLENHRGGVLIVSSGLAFSGGTGKPENLRAPHRSLYASSKAALEVFGRTVAEELHDTGATVTVVCPPPTSTEWNGGRYTDAMDPADVATATLNAYQRGELMCFPGLEDPSVWDALAAAETAVMHGNAEAELAPRYR